MSQQLPDEVIEASALAECGPVSFCTALNSRQTPADFRPSRSRRMTERDMQSKMTDAQLDTLFKSLAQGIELLHDLSDVGDGGRARILFYALAMYLD